MSTTYADMMDNTDTNCNTKKVRYDMNELAKSEPAQSQAYRGEFECPFCGEAGHIIETATDVAESDHCEHVVSVGDGEVEFYREG